MAFLRRWGTRRWYALAGVLTVPLLLAGPAGAQAGSAASTPRPSGGGRAIQAATGHVTAGRLIHAATSRKPFVPTAAQRAARAQAMHKILGLPKAPVGPHSTAADVSQLRGLQTTPGTAQAPGTFTSFKNSALPAQCGECAQSVVNEPDTANSGRYALQTSNWDIAYTTTFQNTPPTWL
jgi:hypothetical protein